MRLVITIERLPCLSVEDQKILYSGNGFVEVPEEERHRERIDAYPYLIP